MRDNGLGDYIKSSNHFFNSCKRIVKDLGFDGISEEIEVDLEALYVLSQSREYDFQEYDLRVPALWYSYQLRECKTKECVIEMSKILGMLLNDLEEFMKKDDPSVFDKYEEMRYEEWAR